MAFCLGAMLVSGSVHQLHINQVAFIIDETSRQVSKCLDENEGFAKTTNMVPKLIVIPQRGT